jgi:hypothetical protein
MAKTMDLLLTRHVTLAAARILDVLLPAQHLPNGYSAPCHQAATCSPKRSGNPAAGYHRGPLRSACSNRCRRPNKRPLWRFRPRRGWMETAIGHRMISIVTSATDALARRTHPSWSQLAPAGGVFTNCESCGGIKNGREKPRFVFGRREDWRDEIGIAPWLSSCECFQQSYSSACRSTKRDERM